MSLREIFAFVFGRSLSGARPEKQSERPAPNESAPPKLSQYPPAFIRALGFVLPHECEYVRGHWGDQNFVTTENVSGDAGGLTKWGIDQRSHPGVDIAALTYAQACAIYYAEWCKYLINQLPARIAIAQFDVRVNGGFAVKWLQLAIQHVDPLARITVDGVMGPATISAANLLTPEQETALLRYFIRQRDARFESIATGSRAKFLNGWEQRDRDLEKYLGI